MKNIKNSGLLRLVTLVTMIFVVTVFSMRASEMGQEAAQSSMMKQQQPKKQYFIHEMNDKSKGIWVDKELVDDNCKSIKAMVEDVGGELNEIPLDLPINVIELVFSVLSNNVDINDLSLTDLISVVNAFNFLDVSADKLNLVLAKIENETVYKGDGRNINVQLKQLNSDLQKSLIFDATIDCLKNFIIKKYAKDRGKSFFGHPMSVRTVAFSPDGKYIVSGCEGRKHNLILWNAETGQKIKVVSDGPMGVNVVAFSPNGKNFVSYSYPHSLLLWDISNINNIKSKSMLTKSDTVSVAFSPDGKSFVAGEVKGDFVLRDISDPDNIKSEKLTGHSGPVRSVAFSSDGKYIVLSCSELLLWDVTNLNNIISYNLSHKLRDPNALVAFHPNGKQFVSCGNDLILWDITDPNNISHKLLRAFSNTGTGIAKGAVRSLAFNNDGKRLALGYNNGFIVLDINDPENNIVHFDKFGADSLAWSPDDKQIVTGGWEMITRRNLILWTLLSEQEEMLLKELKNYSADQIRLIYTFCLRALKGETISSKADSEEQDTFMTLPKDMQQLLKDPFFSQ